MYAVKSYNPEKGEFLTYATHFIDGEMKQEMSYQWNSLEITEYSDNLSAGELWKKLSPEHAGISVKDAPDRGAYSEERRVLQIMELNPLSYTGENDRDYRIKYKGYEEERLKAKFHKEKGKRAPVITGFSYVHLFSKEEPDRK